MENIEIDKADQTSERLYNRSAILTVLCLIAYVFFGFLSVLFLTGAMYSEWISMVTNQYMPEEQYTTTELRFVFLAGFMLHFSALIGAVFIWRLKISGYYILGIACLVIAAYQLLSPNFTAASTIIYILFLIGFGIFYRRLN
jgi:hypothetical protein